MTVLDLSQEAQITFGGTVFWLMGEYERSYQECYRVLTEAWGLNCFHPLPQRRPIKPGVYECRICQCWVLETQQQAGVKDPSKSDG